MDWSTCPHGDSASDILSIRVTHDEKRDKVARHAARQPTRSSLSVTQYLVTQQSPKATPVSLVPFFPLWFLLQGHPLELAVQVVQVMMPGPQPEAVWH